MYIIELNEIDKSIKLGSLNAELSLKTVQVSYSWSPTLASAILHVQLLNYVRTKLKINSINRTRLSSIVARIQSYNISQRIPDTTTKDMKKINTDLRQAHKHLN